MSFDEGQVKLLIDEALTNILAKKPYQPDQVGEWSNKIVNQALESLQETAGYKYVVLVTIMQKSGAGLHSVSSCLWDEESDKSVAIQWDNDTMHCIVTVFAIKI